MNTLTIVLITLIALAGLPTGVLIAHLTKEELKPGKKYFEIILIVCAVLLILSLILFTGETVLFLSLAFVFIFLLTLGSLIKAK
ncbi:MAG: hypothetical protein ABH817_00950 [archaeon]